MQTCERACCHSLSSSSSLTQRSLNFIFLMKRTPNLYSGFEDCASLRYSFLTR